MILLPPEFKRLLCALSAKNVDYLVVGGYAVIYHGYVRTTGDLNIWVALKRAAGRNKDLADLDYLP